MMMGMMTLVRVLPPDLYERVMNDVRSGHVALLPSASAHLHHHEAGAK
jgi:hypothetical protein